MKLSEMEKYGKAGIYESGERIPVGLMQLLKVFSVDEGITVAVADGILPADICLHVEAAGSFCLSVVLSGRFDAAFSGGAALSAREGDIVMMSAGSDAVVGGRVRFFGGSTLRFIDIRIRPDILKKLIGRDCVDMTRSLLDNCSLPHLCFFMGARPATAVMLKIAADIAGYTSDYSDAALFFMRAKVWEVLAEIVGQLHRMEDAGQHAGMTVADKNRLWQAQAYIDANRGKNCTVGGICRHAGINEKKLQAGFRSLFGMSVHRYTTGVRIRAAAEMLAGGKTVGEVAGAVGFAGVSHFIRIFKETMGLTPSQWARNNFNG